MPPNPQQYLQWNGERFRRWAAKTGKNTHTVIDALLSGYKVEQQGYKACMGILKLADQYSAERLENACKKALSVPVTYADTSALERDFGFKPSTSLSEGLRRLAEWYKEFYRID